MSMMKEKNKKFAKQKYYPVTQIIAGKENNNMHQMKILSCNPDYSW